MKQELSKLVVDYLGSLLKTETKKNELIKIDYAIKGAQSGQVSFKENQKDFKCVIDIPLIDLNGNNLGRTTYYEISIGDMMAFIYDKQTTIISIAVELDKKVSMLESKLNTGVSSKQLTKEEITEIIKDFFKQHIKPEVSI